MRRVYVRASRRLRYRTSDGGTTVASDLGTGISGTQAAITFSALTMAAFMLTGGKPGDRWGRGGATAAAPGTTR